MLLGFNHNVMYKGAVFHVQTEDSGIANPHIITLLYKGGVILCSKKTSYADILKMESLEQVVEELMKEQHKEMMRRLKSGEFDERAFSAPSAPSDTATTPSVPPAAATTGDIQSPRAAQEPSSSGTDAPLPSEVTAPKGDAPIDPPAGSRVARKSPASLDDAVIAFFDANEK